MRALDGIKKPDLFQIGFQRGGGDSNPRWTGAHNSFRDYPIQPLWHLPNFREAGEIITDVYPRILQIHTLVQFWIMHLTQLLIFQESHQGHGLFFFTMYQKNLLDCILHTQRIFQEQVLTRMT